MPNTAGSPNAQWKQNILHNTKTTDIFVPRFTLYREYRTINLDNVTYTMYKYPTMYKTKSSPRNINMKSLIYTISTITTPNLISAALFYATPSNILLGRATAIYNG